MKELPKAYEPQKYEDDIYKRWEESGFFSPDASPPWVDNPDDPKRPSFSIVLPPPNVTGTLHMGHAAMLAIQDLMVRYHRMKGDKTLWLPGTDHAAVATESKVEKLLIKNEGFTKPKEELGKEKFLERVDKFAQESHDTIVNQTKKMGSSLDWSREAFTLDEQRHKAVYTVFKKMYDDGLIYRGYRVINWSVKGQSTCSDDELVHVERQAKIYTFKYSEDFPIEIATTRPETKLGDTAVAVNPKDKRYKKLIGKVFEVENFADSGLDLKINIIADDHVDMKYGTGAVGVTPAHSSVDFDMYMAQKANGNDIGLIEVIDKDAKMTDKAGSYEGLGVLEARGKVVEALKKNKLFIQEEETIQNVGTSDRFGDVVEALPMTQWFIDVNKKFTVENAKLKDVENGKDYSLKELMQKAVKSKQIEIIPERFDKTYFHWIDNLRDWCISRQIWYGHQIPVWYKGEEIYVGTEAPEGEGWEQDSDTLDTWFSSGLWTFSTLGWPDETADMKNFHPTSVMETGYDILFFWVARMILMSTYVLGDVPFEKVYLHGLVRDENGEKMSKTLGNVIDPLDSIKEYGADATRLSLLLGNTPGNDVKLNEDKIASFRNFANKLWNMSRFMLMNIDEPKIDIARPEAKTLADKWVLYRLDRIVLELENSFKKFDFSFAGEQLKSFTWDYLADDYLEYAKIESGKEEILNYILNTILKLWHPFMPFVTEAIWQEIYGNKQILMVEKFPEDTVELDEDSFQNFQKIKNVIAKIRNVRAENGIEPAKKIDVKISAGDKKVLIEENEQIIKRHWTNIENLEIGEKIDQPEGWLGFVEGGVEVFVDLSGAIDKDKLKKEAENLEKYIVGVEKKLENKKFVDNAPKEVIEKEQGKLREAKEKLEKIKEQI